MEKILKPFGVLICGLVTSVLTAILVTTLSKMIGIEIFTFSLWLIIPVGAIFTGILAATGYYFGSLYFHTKPNLLIFVQMVVIAGLTMLLIYYMEYNNLILDDGTKATSLVSFKEYLDLTLTSAHYRIGRGAGVDTGEVGQLGYLIAAVQFVGFLLGGVGVFLVLMTKPICKKCELYLRPLVKLQKHFPDTDSLAAYYDQLFQFPLDSSEFKQLIKLDAKCEIKQGVFLDKTTLYGCPGCKSQSIEDEVQVFNGKEWNTVKDLYRRILIPEGINLIDIFKK